MAEAQKLTGSIWFATGVALLVSLGAQTLIEAPLPIAGETSLWLVDTLIRALAFALAAPVGALLVAVIFRMRRAAC